MFCHFCSVCFHLSWCSVSGSTPQLDCHQSGTCPKALCWTLTRNWMQKSSFKILCPYRKWWFSKPSLFTGWHPVFLPKINIVLVSIHIWCDSPGKKKCWYLISVNILHCFHVWFTRLIKKGYPCHNKNDPSHTHHLIPSRKLQSHAVMPIIWLVV